MAERENPAASGTGMDDPVQRHPTRAEQLDIMASVIAALARPGDQLLDLGCGVGYFVHLLEAKRRDLAVTGVDLKAEALDRARARFGEDRFTWIKGDLGDPPSLALPAGRYRFVTTALTFHDLSDAQKQAVIARVAALLSHDGLFLLYDRIRLSEPALFPVQTAIWGRLERVYGFGMRSTADFAAYEADLSRTNFPARLEDYGAWLAACGLAHAIVHLHGNIVILAATKKESDR
jgi:tRNA (cmo5U34)-methyltransferase